MNKGINTTILEGKQTLTNTINGLLQSGIPVSVVSMMIEGVYHELEVLLKNSCEQEQKEFEEQQERESHQVADDGTVTADEAIVNLARVAEQVCSDEEI